MATVENRLDRIEKQIGQAGCVCQEQGHMKIMAIGDGWTPEDIERGEASLSFTCPTHGVQSPPLLRISEVDARL